ncbi:MAG: AraC family transcriptional regulator [Clostridia bacterium]|nr:AraC family transcriptional regulator [Clostridia bacterium]
MPISCGEQRCTPNHSWGAGVRSYYLIHYVISGKGVFYCGTQKHVLHPGQIFVIFPGTVVKYVADAKEPWHYAWVAFDGDEGKEVLACAGITPLSPVMELLGGAEVLSCIRKMPRDCNADLRLGLEFTGRTYTFLSLLLQNERRETVSESSYLAGAVKYVKAYYHKELTVEELADHVGISRKYLFAIFKRGLGVSPKEYLTAYRMERAKELLSDPTISVGSVAYSVGYRDPLNFSKIFKQRTGVSPKEYRAAL